jgi:hypothetical protein
MKVIMESVTRGVTASTGVNPRYLDLWQSAHQGNVYATEKLVSINFLLWHIICYICIKLNIPQDRYTEELKKIHMPDLEDPRSVPFNVNDAYDAGGGTPYGRYVKVSIVFR